MRNCGVLSRLIALPSGIVLAGAASAQSISFDNKPRPGSPVTGWSGNFSPFDPYSEDPGKGAWITKAGLIHSRSEVAVGEVNGKMYVLGGYTDGNVAQHVQFNQPARLKSNKLGHVPGRPEPSLPASGSSHRVPVGEPRDRSLCFMGISSIPRVDPSPLFRT
jgi:hypothetical protein